MVQYMGIVNLSTDSGFGSVSSPAELSERIEYLTGRGVAILDIGAVSTRPGAEPVTVEEEWERLAPALEQIREVGVVPEISIDTTSSEIVSRAYRIIGPFIVNDISAGEDDAAMLDTVRRLGLRYIAMHKRGTPQTMDGLCDYPDGVMNELIRYFTAFDSKAGGIGWILDPGLGFAKTDAQNWEILENLSVLKRFRRPILVSCSDKRFVRAHPDRDAEALAVAGGADILRVHHC